MLRTPSTDENIAETDDEITMSTQPSNKTTPYYVKESVAKARGCGNMYEDHHLKYVFIKERDNSIRQA